MLVLEIHAVVAQCLHLSSPKRTLHFWIQIKVNRKQKQPVNVVASLDTVLIVWHLPITSEVLRLNILTFSPVYTFFFVDPNNRACVLSVRGNS
jgi:hypothetical protein